MATEAQKLKILNIYGAASEEVCYAHERLMKLGVEPYTGSVDGKTITILKSAIEQAKKDGKSVAVMLNDETVRGLFTVSPSQAPAMMTYMEFAEHGDKMRWDKPIEQQKKEEEFDRFREYEYKRKIFNLYGTASEEVCYAHERLEKLGVVPFQGAYDGMVGDIFAAAMKESKEIDKKVALFLDSGVVTGLFVLSPDKKANDPAYCSSKFQEYVKGQKKLRWDKPIEQQKAEERSSSSKGARQV